MLALRQSSSRIAALAAARPAGVSAMTLVARQHSTLPDPQAKKHRPLSPHLTIYNWQLTNSLSALHRITGAATGGAFYLAGFAAAAGLGSAELVQLAAAVPAPLFFLAKLGIAVPTSYHTFNGLRHLVWDSGRALDLKGVYQTGYAVLAATAVGTVGLMMM
ncbi:hypothetical protein BCR44DRAFT_1509417 [Catenaria anguillulae PL171]|uniref:Succinate dehydrogenase cytochrome b560 subunit n=1 Tax=Catenaria anguillulae PL171 TaxID=765915 RepID=A0A1Y2I4W0_9FUNG|nr:hypothetical protein BCR44DRAFT_1509417 [Catenaria anguillulae PL171]